MGDAEVVLRFRGQAHLLSSERREQLSYLVWSAALANLREDPGQVGVVFVSCLRKHGNANGIPDVVEHFIDRSIQRKVWWTELLAQLGMPNV